jgi:carboxylesterase type B
MVLVSAGIAVRSVIPPFSQVADGDLIPAKPFAAIADGSGRGIPLIVGTNLEEMKLYRFLDPAVDQLTDATLVERCRVLFPGAGADGRVNAERAVEVYREARAARGEDVSPAEVWLAIATDQTFRAGALRLAELHAAHTPDVFVYQFAWNRNKVRKSHVECSTRWPPQRAYFSRRQRRAAGRTPGVRARPRRVIGRGRREEAEPA